MESPFLPLQFYNHQRQYHKFLLAILRTSWKYPRGNRQLSQLRLMRALEVAQFQQNSYARRCHKEYPQIGLPKLRR